VVGGWSILCGRSKSRRCRLRGSAHTGRACKAGHRQTPGGSAWGSPRSVGGCTRVGAQDGHGLAAWRTSQRRDSTIGDGSRFARHHPLPLKLRSFFSGIFCTLLARSHNSPGGAPPPVMSGSSRHPPLPRLDDTGQDACRHLPAWRARPGTPAYPVRL
jgi:hypothetical protein